MNMVLISDSYNLCNFVFAYTYIISNNYQISLI